MNTPVSEKEALNFANETAVESLRYQIGTAAWILCYAEYIYWTQVHTDCQSERINKMCSPQYLKSKEVAL